MKNLKTALVVILLVAGFGTSNAQFSRWWYQFMAQMRQTKWVVGAHWNVVEDDGRPFQKLFDVNRAWDLPGYPSRVTVEKYLKDGWSVEASLTYNRYRSGKLINGNDVVGGDKTFFCFDALGKYDFNKLYNLNDAMFGGQQILQPYGTFGLSYTYRAFGTFPHSPNLDLGLGLNVWAYENWGVQLQGLSKFGMIGRFFWSHANYMQYTFGVVYKINPKKGGAGSGSRYKFKKHRIKKGL